MSNKIEIGDLIYIKQFKSIYLVGDPRLVPGFVTLKEGYAPGDCTLAKMGGLNVTMIGGCNPYHREPCVWNTLALLNSYLEKGKVTLISKNIVEIFNKAAKKVK